MVRECRRRCNTVENIHKVIGSWDRVTLSERPRKESQKEVIILIFIFFYFRSLLSQPVSEIFSFFDAFSHLSNLRKRVLRRVTIPQGTCFALSTKLSPARRNLRNFRMRDCWNQDTNALKLHEKQSRSQFTVWREIFLGIISRILDFSGFEGKNSRIWILDFTRGNNYSRNSCAVFESNKSESHIVDFVTRFAANFIEVQQCKKGVCFCRIFVGGSSFSRDLIIADQWKIFKICDN